MKFEYKLIRSNRKSISVAINSDNEITVRCPRTVSVARVEEFLTKKSLWIENYLNYNSDKIRKNADIINFKSVLVRGETYPLNIGEKTALSGGEVFIKDKKHVIKLLKDVCEEEFLQRYRTISLDTEIFATAVGFKNYKSRWGCCDRNGNIYFSYKVLMLPVNLQNYIIVHELCHIIQFNHSAKFWSGVSEYVPDYKVLRKRLKDYDFILKLY